MANTYILLIMKEAKIKVVDSLSHILAFYFNVRNPEIKNKI